MRRLAEYLFVRQRHNWLLLIRFGLVGGSGVLVNMLALIVIKKLGPQQEAVFLGLPLTDFNIRWYHVYSTAAFLIANLWNFQLNRTWTFKSGKHARWISEYWPFLVVGAIGQALGLGLETLLMHPHSPIGLPSSVFDDSTGLRTKFYWAHLIMIAVTTPITFLLNKLWTFRAVRHREEALPGSGMPAFENVGGAPAASRGRRAPAARLGRAGTRTDSTGTRTDSRGTEAAPAAGTPEPADAPMPVDATVPPGAQLEARRGTPAP